MRNHGNSTSAATHSSAPKAATIRKSPKPTRANRSRCARQQFFAARVGVGAPDPDPIFIVGLPRSGSTLIEQILASHSQVEGTQELADIQRIVLGDAGPPTTIDYPGVLAELAPEEFRRLGERYMTDTRAYRRAKAILHRQDAE